MLEAGAGGPSGIFCAAMRVLASSKGGELFVDTQKGKRPRTVPLVAELVPWADGWAEGKQGAPTGCRAHLGADR